MSKVGFGRNRNRKPNERIVGWGKYRGMLMEEVPTQYLEWFVRNAYHQMQARKVWAQEELDRRFESSDATEELPIPTEPPQQYKGDKR